MPDRYRTGPDKYGHLTGRDFGPCGGRMRRGFVRNIGFRRYLEQEPITKEEQKKIGNGIKKYRNGKKGNRK